MTEIPNIKYAKVSHVMYQSCFITDMLKTNTSKNQKRLMPIIPNTDTCKYQSFWRSEMSSFNNVDMNCFTLINRVEYQLCQSQK